MTQTQDEIRTQFIEDMGLMAQGDGMARIAGRILGLLIFDGTSASFSDLADELQVSRGSISVNVRMLIDRGIIRKTAKPGDRQDYFQIGERPYEDIFTRLVTRAGQNAQTVRSTLERLGESDPARRARIADFEQFYEALADCARSGAERLAKGKAAGK